MNAVARPTGSKSVCDQVLVSLLQIIHSIDMDSRVLVDGFNCLEDWEKSTILASLQRLVALMSTRQMKAAPILSTGSLETSGEDPGSLSAGVNAEDFTPTESYGTEAWKKLS